MDVRKFIGGAVAATGAWMAYRGAQMQGAAADRLAVVPVAFTPAGQPIASTGFDSIMRPIQGAASDPDVTPILRLIRRAEAGPAGYNAISRLVGKHLYPGRAVTEMTVAEVLQWQEAIDQYQNSEAVGAYQFMPVTLARLVAQGHAKKGEKFGAAVQDRLAVELLRGRGLDRFFSGSLSPDQFADRIAREWAGLPVTKTQPGHNRTVHSGESYYAGFNGNGATVDVASVRIALNNAKG